MQKQTKSGHVKRFKTILDHINSLKKDFEIVYKLVNLNLSTNDD